MRRQVQLLIALLAGACGSKGDRAPEATAAPRDPLGDVALPAGATSIDGNQFRLAAAALPGCAAGADCAALVDLHALGGFKVNLDYPYKFVAAPAAAITPAATFTPRGIHDGRLVLRFRRPSPAAVTVAGTFKLSVCNPERCLIEEAPLAIAFP